MRTALEVVFWACVALIAWTHVGYGATLALIARRSAPGSVSDHRRA